MIRLPLQGKTHWMFLGFFVVVLCSVFSFLYLHSQDTVIPAVQSEHFIVKAWENDNGVMAWLAMAVKSLIGIV